MIRKDDSEDRRTGFSSEECGYLHIYDFLSWLVYYTDFEVSFFSSPSVFFFSLFFSFIFFHLSKTRTQTWPKNPHTMHPSHSMQRNASTYHSTPQLSEPMPPPHAVFISTNPTPPHRIPHTHTNHPAPRTAHPSSSPDGARRIDVGRVVGMLCNRQGLVLVRSL